MVDQPFQRMTPEEYLAAERQATEKHEYYRGIVYPRGCPPAALFAPGSGRRHSLIASNLVRELSQ